MVRMTDNGLDGLPRTSGRRKPTSDRPHWEFREFWSIRQNMSDFALTARASDNTGCMHAAGAYAVCNANERGRAVSRCIFETHLGTRHRLRAAGTSFLSNCLPLMRDSFALEACISSWGRPHVPPTLSAHRNASRQSLWPVRQPTLSTPNHVPL